MGQRSQIYIKYYDKLIVANYYQWNYGERMISRTRSVIEQIKEYLDNKFYFYFTEPRDSEKLRRFCDVNFDYRDIVMSVDILKSWKDDLSNSLKYEVTNGWKPEEKSDYVFNYWDNNDGQLLIWITDNNKIKYVFAQPSYPSSEEHMLSRIGDATEYIKWDIGDSYDELPPDIKETTQNNIEYLKQFTVMTQDEIDRFVEV